MPFGKVRLPQLDLLRDVLQDAEHARGVDVRLVRDAADWRGFFTRGSESRSRRNCTGSFPAAMASSSMKDWNTNENALLRGARIA